MVVNHELRRTYDEMKINIIKYFIIYYRGKVSRSEKWQENEGERGYAFGDNESEVVYDRPIERVMWGTLGLIVRANRGDLIEFEYYAKKLVLSLLNTNLPT